MRRCTLVQQLPIAVARLWPSTRSVSLGRGSAERVGATLDVLGLGDPWRGLGSKIALLEAYLDDSNKNIREDDLLLFVDAYDVLLLPAATRVRERFEAFERDHPRQIIFNGELACAPDPAFRLAYDRVDGAKPFHFLNSGICRLISFFLNRL